MKKSNFAFLAVAASVLMLSLTQCNTQPSASSSAEPSDSCRHSGLNVAYVDVDTLLTSYELWVSLNEDMINKRENITATVNKEGAALQKEMEQFQNKLNNNAFVSQERAESDLILNSASALFVGDAIPNVTREVAAGLNARYGKQ